MMTYLISVIALVLSRNLGMFCGSCDCEYFHIEPVHMHKIIVKPFN